LASGSTSVDLPHNPGNSNLETIITQREKSSISDSWLPEIACNINKAAPMVGGLGQDHIPILWRVTPWGAASGALIVPGPGFSRNRTGVNPGDQLAARQKLVYRRDMRFEELDVVRSALLETVKRQLESQDPPETRRTWRRLQAAGFSPDEARTMIAAVVYDEMRSMAEEDRPFDRRRFARLLDRLPELPEAGEG
jgi:hypothetical protein